ncbi:MAG: ATP-binding protein [Pseudomonadota bacterium]
MSQRNRIILALLLCALLYVAAVAILMSKRPTSAPASIDSISFFNAKTGLIESVTSEAKLNDRYGACADCRSFYYRMTSVIDGESDFAIYSPYSLHTIRFEVNGKTLVPQRAASSPTGSQLYPIPNEWLPNTANRTLSFGAHSAQPFTAPIYIDSAQLLSNYDYLQTWRHQLAPDFATLVAVIVGLLMGALWLQQNDKPEFGYLAMTSLGWSIYHFVGSSSPLDMLSEWAVTAAVLMSTIVFSSLFLFQLSRSDFSQHHAGSGAVWRHSGGWLMPLASLVGLITLALIVMGYHQSVSLSTSVGVLLWALSLLMLRESVACFWYGSRPRWYIIPLMVLTLLSAHDGLALLIQSERVQVGALHFAVPIFLASFAWKLLSNYIDRLSFAQARNRELDLAVREKTAQLEQQYQQMQALESERLLARERERIMRDMHDGVGGQLVSAMALLTRDTTSPQLVSEALKEALTDMRLMIDSLEPIDNDLNAVLAMFRDRMNPGLAAANVTLKWSVSDLPTCSQLGPAGVLAILRILQESTTNAIKHARASAIELAATYTEDHISIQVIDDGIGFDVDTVRRGHGIKNMAKRASDFGIQHELISRDGKGTEVRLLIPR